MTAQSLPSVDSEAQAYAKSRVDDLVKRILKRECSYTAHMRKGGPRRPPNKDTNELTLPPIEVTILNTQF